MVVRSMTIVKRIWIGSNRNDEVFICHVFDFKTGASAVSLFGKVGNITHNLSLYLALAILLPFAAEAVFVHLAKLHQSTSTKTSQFSRRPQTKVIATPKRMADDEPINDDSDTGMTDETESKRYSLVLVSCVVQFTTIRKDLHVFTVPPAFCSGRQQRAGLKQKERGQKATGDDHGRYAGNGGGFESLPDSSGRGPLKCESLLRACLVVVTAHETTAFTAELWL